MGRKACISVESIALNPITLNEEDMRMIQKAQDIAIYRDANLGAAALVGAQAEAMRDAANNPNGAMMGFMGLGMAGAVGGSNAVDLYNQGELQKAQNAAHVQSSPQASMASHVQSWTCACGTTNTSNFCMQCGAKKPVSTTDTNAWTCTCGTSNTGKFCTECGAPKPLEIASWTCTCGAVNSSNFCTQCGNPKPARVRYVCSTCGFIPDDPSNSPRFCPECGSPFDENDHVKE